MKGSCSSCRQVNENIGRYCKPCRARYMRDWRKKQRMELVALRAFFHVEHRAERGFNGDEGP